MEDFESAIMKTDNFVAKFRKSVGHLKRKMTQMSCENLYEIYTNRLLGAMRRY